MFWHHSRNLEEQLHNVMDEPKPQFAKSNRPMLENLYRVVSYYRSLRINQYTERESITVISGSYF